MLGVQRIPSYVALPACVIGGAALRCLLIQINQLAVERLGWDLIDYHGDYGSHTELQAAYHKDVIDYWGAKHSIPEPSRAGVTLYLSVLLSVGNEIVCHFFLYRRVLPRLLPPSISRYIWLLPMVDSITYALFPDGPRSHLRSNNIHGCFLYLIRAVVEHHLGQLSAACATVGFSLYEVQYLTGYLTAGEKIRAMDPLYLIHWRVLSVVFYVLGKNIIPAPIRLLYSAMLPSR